MEKEIIAAFDFDGTITKKDTLFDFIKFYYGKHKLILGLIILSPILLSFKIGLIKNSKAKEFLFSYFFKKTSISKFNSMCQLYSERINSICKEEILSKIEWHIEQKHTVVIVSASIKNWIEPWALNHDIKRVISTEINVKDDVIEGTFKTNNCYGQEKVNRLLEIFPNRDNFILYAYGDSRGDYELLQFADNPQFVRN